MGIKAQHARRRRRTYRSGKYIVHDERRFIYFVVQKVACTSIKTALMSLFDVDPSRYEVTLDDGTHLVLVHRLFDESGYQVDKEQLLRRIARGEYRDYFKFAFVRNPYDRLVSCYIQKLIPRKHGVRTATFPDKHEEFYVGMPFAEFARAVCAIPDEEANPHFRSQSAVLLRPDGELVCDFVGRFENLQADFAYVAQRIGAPGLVLPHLLPSLSREGRHYREFYDERTRKLVSERYAGDLDVFGYSF